MLAKLKFLNRDAVPVFLFIFFSGLYFFSTVGIMNSLNASQYALTQAITEKGTISIDNYTRWVYLDYAENNGHKYSYRAPGESILAIPFYALAKVLQPFAAAPYNENHIGITDESKTEALTTMCNAVFGAGSVVVLYNIAYSLTKSRFLSLYTATTTGIGTLLWRYAAGFQRFSISSFLLLILIYLILRMNGYIYQYITYGVCSGLLIFVDPSLIGLDALFTGAFLIFSIKIARNRALVIIITILSAMVPILIFLLYNYKAFGSLLGTPYLHGPKGRVYNDPGNY